MAGDTTPSIGGLPLPVRGLGSSPLGLALKGTPEPEPDGGRGPSATSLLPWRRGPEAAGCSASALSSVGRPAGQPVFPASRPAGAHAGEWDTCSS